MLKLVYLTSVAVPHKDRERSLECHEMRGNTWATRVGVPYRSEVKTTIEGSSDREYIERGRRR